MLFFKESPYIITGMTNSHEQAENSPTEPAAESYPISQKDLEAAQNLAANPAHEFRKILWTQAENMARQAKIELQHDEISLYCALREQLSPNMDGGAKDAKQEETRPWQLMSDQEILATVLELKGDPDCIQKFKSFFSNIFETGRAK